MSHNGNVTYCLFLFHWSNTSSKLPECSDWVKVRMVVKRAQLKLPTPTRSGVINITWILTHLENPHFGFTVLLQLWVRVWVRIMSKGLINLLCFILWKSLILSFFKCSFSAFWLSRTWSGIKCWRGFGGICFMMSAFPSWLLFTPGSTQKQLKHFDYLHCSGTRKSSLWIKSFLKGKGSPGVCFLCVCVF